MKYATDPETFQRLLQRFRQGQPAVERDPAAAGPGLQVADESTYIARAAILRAASRCSRARSATSAARARSASSATRSPPTTSARPARSKPPRPPACICGSTACGGGLQQLGSRRGNHEVMMRGTFANVRIKNLMLPRRRTARDEGGMTLHQPRRADVDLRCRDEIHRAGHADGDLRAARNTAPAQLARLGRQGHAAARRQGGDRQELRAHPPQQPGRAWACCPAVQGQRHADVAG